MKLTFLSLLAIGFSALAYYDDNPEVMAYANSGSPILTSTTKGCKGDFPVQLGQDKYSSYCVNVDALPLPVISEVEQMKSEELENNSDYDSRITRFHMFSHRTFSGEAMGSEGIRQLAEAFGIPKEQFSEFSISFEKVSQESFGQLEGQYVGAEYLEEPLALEFLRDQLAGQSALIMTLAGPEIGLYPGGGFNATHYFVITKEKIAYIKVSWWDA